MPNSPAESVAADRRLTRVAGALYLATFATSIPALALKAPFLGGDAGAESAQWAVVLELLLAASCVGTAVSLYPILRRVSPVLSLGFVASRILEAALVALGVVALLALVTVRADAPTSSGSVDAALVAVHDWAFLVGPGLLPAANAILFGAVLLRGRFVPRVIPIVGLAGAPLLAASALATIFGALDQVSPLAGLAALPIALWEFSIGVWMLTRGFTTSAAATASPTKASAVAAADGARGTAGSASSASPAG